MLQKVQKLVTVLATSASMFETMGKQELRLEQIRGIYNLMTFKDQTKALLNSKIEVKAMSPIFSCQLGFKVRQNNVKAQKIDGTILKAYGIIVSTLSVSDKDGRERFLKRAFFWLMLSWI